MPEVLEAHQDYKRADQEALELRFRARARLGLAILRERGKGTPQEKIARNLGRTREQVRRYEQAYRDWQRDHPGEPLD
jgi:predicted transcriptional regulator